MTKHQCPKCESYLEEIDVLITEDDTECGLSCIECDFVISGVLLGEFLFEDYNEDMYQ